MPSNRSWLSSVRVGHPAGKRCLEGIDLVDALAGIGAFTEQILVNVGHGRGIGVDAVHAGKDALEQRTLAADRQRRRDPWLQHGMARHDPAGGGIEVRPVEWVRHLADQAMDRVARQSGVGVERDDVANAGGRGWGLPADADETGVGRTTQQPVEFVQLAALAFPADPSRFAGVPEPPAVEQKEAVATRRRAVALIEPGNAGHRRFEQRLIAFDMLGRRVEPVGEESEMQFAFRARKVMDLQTLDLCLDRLGRRQQRGHGDNRAQIRAARHREAPEPATALHRSRASHSGSPPPPPRRWPAPHPGHRAGRATSSPDLGRATRIAAWREGRRRQGLRRRHSRRFRASVSGTGPGSDGRAGTRRLSRTRGVRPRAGDSPDLRGGRFVLATRSRAESSGIARTAAFDASTAARVMSSSVRFGAARQFLDGAAVKVARREIHVAKRGAGGEHIVYQADALDQLGPIDVGDHAHAGDDVAHRDHRGALRLVFVMHDRVCR